LLFVLALAIGVLADTSVDFHLNNIIEQFPTSPELVQIQASLLSSQGTGIDVRDEIATLLHKMAKDIMKEEATERSNNVRVQNACDRAHRRYRSKIYRSKQIEKASAARQANYRRSAQKIPGIVKGIERQINKVKIQIKAAQHNIQRKQQQRDKDRDAYLHSLADFNKALDDIDKLRVLVETGLSNRGQGASTSDTRHTQSPTSKKTVTKSPTKYVQKNTHTGVKTSKLVETKDDGSDDSFLEVKSELSLKSTQELSAMSRSEAVQAFQGIYDSLRETTSRSPVVHHTLGIIDSVLTELNNGNAVDKIRSLLIQVRNELQKNKRQQTIAENEAITAWKEHKISLQDAVGDLRISWQGMYLQKAQQWRRYGILHMQEGRAMRTFASATRIKDYNQIRLDFETVVCKQQDDDYKAASKKRSGQLAQIKKALNLLAKFNLSGKYGKMVRESIKDVNVGLCRAFDDYSKWVTVANTYKFTSPMSNTVSGFNEEAWKIYPNKDHTGNKFICVSKIKYTFTCESKCDIRTTDKSLSEYWKGTYRLKSRFPRIAYYRHERSFNRRQTTTIRYDKAKKFSSFRNLVFARRRTTTRNAVSVFVVPGCNCFPQNKDYAVTANAAKNNETQPVGLIEPQREKESRVDGK
jgi:hypothetical protein